MNTVLVDINKLYIVKINFGNLINNNINNNNNNNIYGYDFDGVLHKTVSQADNTGQRHPLPNTIYQPFTKIINQIKNQIKSNKVYIVTGRKKGLSEITNFLSSQNLQNLEIYYTNNSPKSDILKSLKITEFYDDSPIVINEIYNAKLPDLKKLYLVIPESDNWVEITKNNIDLYKITKSNLYKVLSYNISFEAMTGKTTAGVIFQCPISSNGNTECLNNVAQFIENNGPYDFVGLQEASKYYNIIKLSPKLQQMKYIHFTPFREELVTFYDSKYILDTDINTVTGNMKDRGRPFMILFFQNKTCVINMHCGHDDDFYDFLKYINYNSNRSIILNKLRTYNIILIGDMNNPLNDNLKMKKYETEIFDRHLFGINKVNTCCDNGLKANKFNMTINYDHILSTSSNIKTTVYNVPTPASDHLPIIGIINF
jgi:hypothetical protein